MSEMPDGRVTGLLGGLTQESSQMTAALRCLMAVVQETLSKSCVADVGQSTKRAMRSENKLRHQVMGR